MKADDIGNDLVEETAQVVVRRLKDEPFYFRRTGKPLYIVFPAGGGLAISGKFPTLIGRAVHTGIWPTSWKEPPVGPGRCITSSAL